MNDISERGMVLVGCGKMGSAMLAGWLAQGMVAAAIHVIEPHPSAWLQATGVNLNGTLPKQPALVLVAVKPQMMGAALPQVQPYGGGNTVFLSIAAGTPMAAFEAALGEGTPIIRAMPNTPAAIGQGITALVGNAQVTPAQMDVAEGLLAAIGQTVRLDSEAQIDAVTGVSGSGPAYVFHLIETLAAAGVEQGLPAPLAMRLAKATVAGAGALAAADDADPATLRVNVTSPNGTTQAALAVLMDRETGFPALVSKAVDAATRRSEELGRG